MVSDQGDHLEQSGALCFNQRVQKQVGIKPPNMKLVDKLFNLLRHTRAQNNNTDI